MKNTINNKMKKVINLLLVLFAVSTSFGQGGRHILQNELKTINGQALTAPGGGDIVIATSGGNGSGAGVSYVLSSTAPSTDVFWLDQSAIRNQAYPVRQFVRGAWTPVTDECMWYDTVGKVLSRGVPLPVAFDGQSNVEYGLYFSASDPSYGGDKTTDNHVTYWNGSKFIVYTFATRVYPLADGNGPGNITYFAKQFSKKYGRSIRLIGGRHGGQPLVHWEAGGAYWNELTGNITASGVDKLDAFIWVQGEAGQGSGSAFGSYRESFIDFLSRLQAQTWGNKGKLKIITSSHQIENDAAYTYKDGAEYTFRNFLNDDNPYTTYIGGFVSEEAKLNDQGQPTTDVYHMTIKEQEKMGATFLVAYDNTPQYGTTKSPYFVMRDAGNTSMSLTAPALDEITTNHFNVTNNSGNGFTRAFGFGGNGVATVKEVVRPVGNYGQGAIQYWVRGGANNTAADEGQLVFEINSDGIVAKKVSMVGRGVVNTTSNVTIDDSYDQKIIMVESDGDQTFTVNNISPGVRVEVIHWGAGTITFAGSGGVGVGGGAGPKLTGYGTKATLIGFANAKVSLTGSVTP